MQDSGSMAMSEPSGLNGVERLVVPSDPGIRTFIPFGMNGTSVIISPYGEILRMSQYLTEDEPRIICLGSPTLRGYQRDLYGVGNKLHEMAQIRNTGLHVRLMPASGGEMSSVETKLEWINGRWPCIYYKVDDLEVSVLFTVHEGVLSQRYLIANRSAGQKSLQHALQIGGAEVNTLHLEGSEWVGAGEDEWLDEGLENLPHTTYAFQVAEKQWEKTLEVVHHDGDSAAEISTRDETVTPEAIQHDGNTAKITTRGEAVIAVFHNDGIVAPEDACQLPVLSNASDSDDEDHDGERRIGGNASSTSFGLLHVASFDVEKLVMQYDLRPYGGQDSRVLRPQDLDTLLKSEKSGNWSFAKTDDINSILRRHLEHILCLCLVDDRSKSGQRIPFINDITFELGSTPMNDFYIFRYLLFMYGVLDTDNHICATPALQNDSPTFDRSALQARIKAVCKGHLRWCFEKAFLTSQSWPSPSKLEGKEVTVDNKSREEAFVGSLQMLKLFEFARLIREEDSLVDECLVKGGKMWLDSLIATQETKSRLWYKDEKKEYLKVNRDEGPESLDLPDYRLGDLIYIWKALKSLEELVCKSDGKTFVSEIQGTLTEYKLHHYDVRKIILQRFLYQPLDTPSSHVIDKSGSRDNQKAVPESTLDASSFSVAVRRSRSRDRSQFTTKDTMLYDGHEWGFFENDLNIEVLSNKEEIVKVNVELAWKRTMESQGDDDHAEIWEKPLRYALAIIMAKFGSLDSSKSPTELQNLSWKRLVTSVVPCGLFTEETDCYTQLPTSLPVSGNQRSSWEIPTLLSRIRFESLELALVKDAPSSSDNIAPARRDGPVGTEQRLPQESNNTSALDAKIDMKKKVDMKKNVGRSYGDMNVQMVFDPIGEMKGPADYLMWKVKEWLYPLPDFIRSRPPYKSVKEELIQGETSGLDGRLDMDRIADFGGLRHKLRRILDRGLTVWKGEKWGRGTEAFSFGAHNAFVVDVGRSTRNEIYTRFEWCDAEDLDEYLRKPRSVEKAKKRFHYIVPLEVEQALILYLNTPVLDRRNMAQFYVRHRSFSSHFHEYVHDIADIWTTELHLSFLQLVDVEERPREGAPEGETVCDGHQRRFFHRYKGSEHDIYKASLSCRFVGDMGDRYWSGYLLAYLPRKLELLESLDDSGNEEDREQWDNCYRWFRRDNHNDQRNILEPFLVEKMVAEAYQSTKRILASVNDYLEPEIDKPKYEKEPTYSHISKVDERNYQAQYSRRSNALPDLEDTLILLNRFSEANCENLRIWQKRETERFHRPRWSRKDELKYRLLVDSQKRLAVRQVSLLIDQRGQIQTTLNRIKSLKQELVDNLSLFEARRAARQSENIRVFTYATVIFYQLSFVASIFSMQGPPKYDTTIPFLQATAIALIITILIVSNAGILIWPLGRLSQRFWFRVKRIARPKMEKTSNVFPVPWGQTLSRIRQADGEDVLNESNYTYLMFLVVYCLVEFPALRVVLAYDFVTKNDITTSNQVGLATVRVLIALLLLPLLLAVWTILVVWSILRWTGNTIWTLPSQIWSDADEQSKNQYLEQEKPKSADGIENKGRWGLKDAGGRNEEKYRQDRKAKEERVRKQVSLLINPPELYKDKLKPYNEKIKALTLREKKGSRKNRTNSVMSDHSSSAPSQPTQQRRIWPFARHGTEKATNDKEGV